DDDCEGFIRGTIELDDDDEDVDDGEHRDEDEEDDVPVAVAGNLDNSMCIKRALQKLRKGLIKIRRSAHRLDKFRTLTIVSGRKQGLSPILDVCTRWGSTYDMIDRALQCKETYCSVLLDDELTDFILEE
ncbi:hypothetical protein BGX27_006909, partial [Mortierella sp. AM989]